MVGRNSLRTLAFELPRGPSVGADCIAQWPHHPNFRVKEKENDEIDRACHTVSVEKIECFSSKKTEYWIVVP